MNDEHENGHGALEQLDDSEELTEDDVMILVDPDGNEHRFVMLALLEIDGSDYAVLAPEGQILDEGQEEVDLTFCLVERDEDDNEFFSQVEDDETFEKVREACAQLLGLDDEA